VTFAMEDERVVLLTIVADRQATRSRGGAEVSATACVERLLTATIAGDGWVDDVVVAVKGNASTQLVRTDAPLVVVRRIAGQAPVVRHVGGTYATLAAPPASVGAAEPELAAAAAGSSMQEWAS
jgi:hypothetical protein